MVMPLSLLHPARKDPLMHVHAGKDITYGLWERRYLARLKRRCSAILIMKEDTLSGAQGSRAAPEIPTILQNSIPAVKSRLNPRRRSARLEGHQWRHAPNPQRLQKAHKSA